MTAGPGDAALPGYQLPDVPAWSMSLTTAYDWALTGLWNAHLGGAWRWVDKRWSELGVQSLASGGAHTMELPAKLSAFVQGDATRPPASIEERVLQPRSIGVGVEYAF